MTWVFYASLMPLLWSLGNVLDQFIAREAFKRSAFSFLVISGLATVPLVIVLAMMFPVVLQIPPFTILILLLAGLIGFAGAWPYIIALTEDDASTAIPVLQTVPVFVYVLGYLLLGETLTWLQMLGGALVVAGAVAFVWNPQTRKIHTRTLLLMLASSLIWAGYAVWIRYWALELPWIAVTFWNFAAWSLLGIVGILLSKPIMGDFKGLFRRNVLHIFLPLIVAQQIFACTADMLQTHAMSLAPTGVQVVLFNGIQPVVIMLLCGLFYYWKPEIYQRLQWNRRLALRFAFVAVSLVGLALLLQV
jgi:drug/metabolite transporter (DMT)-like permease